MVAALAEVSCAVARYVRDKKFSALVISGGSHLLSEHLLVCGWRKLYGTVPLPRIFVISRTVNHLMYKPVREIPLYLEYVTRWMHNYLPDLENLKDGSLCCVDDYAISGLKCTGLAKAFSALGFSCVEFAVFAASDRAELPPGTFVARTDDELAKELYELSMLIQGEPTCYDLLERKQESPAERRRRAHCVLDAVASELGA